MNENKTLLSSKINYDLTYLSSREKLPSRMRIFKRANVWNWRNNEVKFVLLLFIRWLLTWRRQENYFRIVWYGIRKHYYCAIMEVANFNYISLSVNTNNRKKTIMNAIDIIMRKKLSCSIFQWFDNNEASHHESYIEYELMSKQQRMKSRKELALN